jgi:hypothetical protein
MPRRQWPALGAAALFFLLGVPFLTLAGLHCDACDELAGFYPCSHPAFKVRLFGQHVPLMVIQYLGSLKTWLYLPILKYLEVNPLALRLPVLIVGAASVWLFYLLLDRTAGRLAAIVGALLLATDASFLLATTYDFGPIALLHFFLLAGILLLLRFEKTRSSLCLFLGFFLFGLALWHKALFIWMLGGLAVAAAVVLPKRILPLLSPRRIGLAAAALCLGALPLVYYNAVTRGATLHTDSVMSGAAPLSQKLLILRKTIDGSVMFGWLTEDQRPETFLPPEGRVDAIAVRLSKAGGDLRSNWMPYLLAGSICLIPWLWFTQARRSALFALVYMVVVWAQMALLPNTGAAVHHVILLWPVPHFLIAITAAEVARRLPRRLAPCLAGVFVACLGSNLLVVDHYYADLVTHGVTALWSDAVYTLSEYVDSLKGYRIVTVDWGYAPTICLLSDGRVPLDDVSFALLNPSEGDRTLLRSLMMRRDTLFVDHVAGEGMFPGARERLGEIAGQAGFSKQVVGTIADRNGRPRFEISNYSAVAP